MMPKSRTSAAGQPRACCPAAKHFGYRTARFFVLASAIVMATPSFAQAPLQGSPGPAPGNAAPPVPEPIPGGTPATPGVPQSLRWTEDWSHLADPARHTGSPLEALRYLPLGRPDIYLSVGGEVREYYQHWDHLALGAIPSDRLDMLEQRLRLVADLHVGKNLRGFVEIGNNREFGAEFPTPPNRGKTDVMQAFVDMTVPLGDAGMITVRPGRFEMPLGNGKLVGVREGTNYRFTYQGVRATYRLNGRVRIDAFAVRPVSIGPDAFDDGRDDNRHFYGVYIGTGRGVVIPDSTLDAYYYDVYRRTARYAGEIGAEHRSSWGVRVAGRNGPIDYDLEGTFQTGSFAGSRIRAWGTLLDFGYNLPKGTPLAPRLGIRANAFSGDDKPRDGTIGTFSPPAPRLPIYSDAGFLQLSNLIDVYPNITFRPGKSLVIVTGPEFFWRQTNNDTTYVGATSQPGIRPIGSSFVGAAYNAQADWLVTKNLSYRIFYTHHDVSESFERGGGRNTDYIGIWQVLRF